MLRAWLLTCSVIVRLREHIEVFLYDLSLPIVNYSVNACLHHLGCPYGWN